MISAGAIVVTQSLIDLHFFAASLFKPPRLDADNAKIELRTFYLASLPFTQHRFPGKSPHNYARYYEGVNPAVRAWQSSSIRLTVSTWDLAS